MKTKLLLLMAVLTGALTFAQKKDSVLTCGATEEFLTKNIDKNTLAKLKAQWARARVEAVDPNTVYTIPVMFHIAHLGEAVGTGSNLSDAHIQAALLSLNNAFRAKGKWAVGTDAKIQFVLANCNGIDRANASGIPGFASSGVGISNTTMQQQVRQLFGASVQDKYVNIYVCHSLGGPGGYAWFGGDIFVSIYNQSLYHATLIHEMGHVLYLSHTFEGDKGLDCPPNGDPLSQGDYVADTEPHRLADLSWATSAATINPCTSNSYGANTYYNWMAYYNEFDRFSPGQIDRMRNNLVNNLARWITSSAIPTPNNQITINSLSTNSFCAGSSISFSINNASGSSNPVALLSTDGEVIQYININGNSSSFTVANMDITNWTLYDSPNAKFQIKAGCNSSAEISGTYTNMQNFQPLVVNPATPKSEYGFAGRAYTLCPAAQVTLGSEVTQYVYFNQPRTITNLANEGITLQWYKDNTPIGMPNTTQITTGTAGNYSYSIQKNGCPIKQSFGSPAIFNSPTGFNYTINFTASFGKPDCGSAVLYAYYTSNTVSAYKWYKNGVLIPNETSYQYTATSSGNYRVVATDPLCNVENSNDIITVTLVNDTPPTPTATGTTVCAGSSTTLTATGCSGAGAVVKWYYATDTDALSPVSMPTSTAISTEFYARCERTVNGGTCVSPRSAIVTLTVVVPPMPSPTQLVVCKSNTPVTLSASGCVGTGASLKWFNAATNTQVTMPINPSQATEYYAKCENTVNGVNCSSGMSQKVLVSVGGTLVTTSTSTCSGAPVTLYATGCNGVDEAIKWYTAATNVLVNMPVAPTSTTDYYAKCEINRGTSTCVSATSNTVQVNVPTPPVASNAVTCTGNYVNLTATGCTGVNQQLRWFRKDNNAEVYMQVPPVASEYYAKCEINNYGIVCQTAPSNTISVTVLNPATPVATGATICLGNSVTLNAAGCSGPGASVEWVNNSNFNQIISMPVSPAEFTYYNARCKITVNGVSCYSQFSEAVAVTVINQPTPPVATGATICAGSSVTLTATGCAGTLKWFNAATNAAVTMPVSPAANTNYYAKCEITTNSTTCISGASNTVTVSIGNPSAPVATSATICAGSSVTLTATGCAGTLKWFNAATNAAVTMPVSPAANTNYYAKCEINNNGNVCTSAASNTITVQISTPVAPVATGATICSGSSVTLTATACSGTIKWFNATTNAAVTMPVSPTVSTDYYAKCEINNNGNSCTSAPSNTVTVQISSPSAPVATGATICSGSSVTLSATGCSGTLKWFNATSNAAVTMPVSPATNTNYYAKCEINNNSTICISGASNTITVQISTPAAPVATGATICSGSSVTLTATACPGTIKWFNATTNTAVTMPVSPMVNTNYYAKCEINNNGNVCTSAASNTVTVQISIPAAPVATGTTICSGSSVTLSATGCSGSLKWYNAVSNTLVTMPVSPTASTDYYAKCEINNNGNVCTSAASNMVTVQISTPDAPVATGVTICSGNSVTLSATGCSGTLKWFNATSNAAVTMPVSPATNTNYYAKCEINNNSTTCISDASNTVTVTIGNPSPPLATGATICSGSSVTLSATGCSGTLKWFNATTNALVMMPISPIVNTDYYAKCEINNNGNVCTSAASNTVTVQISTPATPVAAGTTICSGSSVTLSATGCSGSLKWYNAVSNTLLTMPVFPTASTNYYAKCEINNNGNICTSAASNTVTVQISTPAAPVATGVTICSGSSVTLSATGCSGSLKWYNAVSNTLVTMPVSPTASTNYYAKCEINNNGNICTSAASNTVTVQISTPAAPVATGATVCVATYVTLTAMGCTGIGATLRWYRKDWNLEVAMPVPAVNAEYFAKCAINNNSFVCESPASNTVSVQVINPLRPEVSGGVTTICLGNSITLTATGCTGEGAILRWFDDITGTPVTMPVSPSTTSYYQARCEITNNGTTCISNSSVNSITLVVTNGPTNQVTVNEDITSGTQVKVAGTIIATNKISNANVEYKAGQSVLLNPGFSALGNVFKAYIGGCN